MNTEETYRLAALLTRKWNDRARAEQFAKERAAADYKKRLSEAAGKVKVVK
jgi:hypothetical protein